MGYLRSFYRYHGHLHHDRIGVVDLWPLERWDPRRAALATAAFQTGFDGGQYIVAIGLLLFAFTTILGWCYYGEKCIEFLLGSRSITPYRILFIALIFVGAIGELREIWEISDTLNGLMAIPNLIAVLFLNPVLVRLVKDFFADPHRVRNPREVQTLVRNDPHT